VLTLSAASCSQVIGAVAQLGEHLLCKQGVSGSIPLSSTIFCPDAVAALLEFEYGSNTAQSASPIVWRPCGAPAAREHKSCLLKKIKVCITSMKCCLFCKNREEKIDLEASRYGFRPMSEAGSNDVVDGLAGRIRKRDRSR
jgi:hypothetical protein